jgi:hypothetical protein
MLFWYSNKEVPALIGSIRFSLEVAENSYEEGFRVQKE